MNKIQLTAEFGVVWTTTIVYYSTDLLIEATVAGPEIPGLYVTDWSLGYNIICITYIPKGVPVNELISKP